ncbi:uncharacterized CRM domain-containing protein At3g25440, chloroplastic-like [Neltuma alba]|uniref:uncharacterized CRM domain-containing protein At3g25440, chloroplastic-like n=1 Tax=Neltuma alba TaxID=207710 RepID=UPI0010A4F6F0|nr:uncharacterized CRM domain-containing protein At3g25440, chloroplastic-like [Prosopis alba]
METSQFMLQTYSGSSSSSFPELLNLFIFSLCRGSLYWFCYLVENVPTDISSPRAILCSISSTHDMCIHPRNCSLARKWLLARYTSNASFELNTNNDVARFSIGKTPDNSNSTTKAKKEKKVKMSRKTKLKELRFYRLKAKKEMNSPISEVRIRYKLEKAKWKEAWLIEKLRKFEAPKSPAEIYDPEILTEEEIHYLKRTGEKKKNYVPVGRRGVFGGVVLNIHLHCKRHETVKVVCKPCKPGQVHEYAEELASLSKGIVIDIKPNNTMIFYRGKNYVQPKVMSTPDTPSKEKALEKYRYEQSLEHTSQFIEKLEKELEEYHQHLERFRKGRESTRRIKMLCVSIILPD